jgi:hypothetical protein
MLHPPISTTSNLTQPLLLYVYLLLVACLLLAMVPLLYLPTFLSLPSLHSLVNPHPVPSLTNNFSHVSALLTSNISLQLFSTPLLKFTGLSFFYPISCSVPLNLISPAVKYSSTCVITIGNISFLVVLLYDLCILPRSIPSTKDVQDWLKQAISARLTIFSCPISPVITRYYPSLT